MPGSINCYADKTVYPPGYCATGNATTPFNTFFILEGVCTRNYLIIGGWYWVRTSDPCRVKTVLYR